jgi:hypothetical protein
LTLALGQDHSDYLLLKPMYVNIKPKAAVIPSAHLGRPLASTFAMNAGKKPCCDMFLRIREGR